MLQPVRTCCSWTCCRLFKNVAAEHSAAISSIFQQDMLPPFRACFSRTSFRLFEHVSAGHVAAFSSMLQPDMLPPFRACYSRACCRLFEHVAAGHVAAGHMQLRLLWTGYTFRYSTGLLSVHTSRCSLGPSSVEKFRSSCLGKLRCSSSLCRA